MYLFAGSTISYFNFTDFVNENPDTVIYDWFYDTSIDTLIANDLKLDGNSNIQGALLMTTIENFYGDNWSVNCQE